jgi:hypothetical protein
LHFKEPSLLELLEVQKAQVERSEEAFLLQLPQYGIDEVNPSSSAFKKPSVCLAFFISRRREQHCSRYSYGLNNGFDIGFFIFSVFPYQSEYPVDYFGSDCI